MTVNATTLGRAAIRGDIAAEELATAARKGWATGAFVFRGDEAPAVDVAGPKRAYGPCDRLEARRLYGAEGAPGALWIRTPDLGPWDGQLAGLPVPLHTHDSDHLTVVTSGAPRFLCVRNGALIVESLNPGDVVVYPAGVPHTFRGDGPFDVVSVQARYRDPADDAFSAPHP